MRHLIILFLGIVATTLAQAQHIPDANFATAIRLQCPTCIDANDSLLPGAAVLTFLDVNRRSISNLDGIQGFVGLNRLNCGFNRLVSLPLLPAGLTELYCGNNQLTGLPTLPSLITLSCDSNQLTNLNNLPTTLQILDCSANPLSMLPTLPPDLLSLICRRNDLSNLPVLPAALQVLDCANNSITALPVLPDLTTLICSGNLITNLPLLPVSMNVINCENNQLSSLPALSQNLTVLNCRNNFINSLPTLPPNLTHLDCDYNQLTNLPALPNNLVDLSCDNNQLTTVPNIPSSLLYLSCNSNNLVNFGNMGSNLIHLQCENNDILYLLVLPTTLTKLNCTNNRLISLPAPLPQGLTDLNCGANLTLSCLPFLPNSLQYLTFDYTNISCLPNMPPNLANIWLPAPPPPICANGSICTYNFIQGRVFFDTNSDGVFNSADYFLHNHIVHDTTSNFVSATDINGSYTIGVDSGIASVITLNNPYNPSYFAISPAVYTITTTASNQIYPNNDFIISSLGNFDDIEVAMSYGLYRPGFDNVFYIHYKNVGTTMLSGNLSLDLDADVSFISASQPSTQVGQNINFNFSNLTPLDTRTIEILVNVDAAVPLSTAINHTLNGILVNDADTTNNQCIGNDVVVGSYDPNDINADKSIICSEVIDDLEEDLVYTIRFQNTGTFYAQNVRVEDTLSAFLDISTFQQIAASHNYRLVFDNILINGARKILAKWYFDNIILLDSFTNEPLSHGYIKYKIKPLANQLANRNEIIASQAHIYFDFNAAINTNVDEIISNVCLGVNQPLSKKAVNSFQIFPNPNNGNFSLRFVENINLETANLYIYNYLGELVAQQKLETANLTIATNNLPAAGYIVKVQTENATFVQTMFIE